VETGISPAFSSRSHYQETHRASGRDGIFENDHFYKFYTKLCDLRDQSNRGSSRTENRSYELYDLTGV